MVFSRIIFREQLGNTYGEFGGKTYHWEIWAKLVKAGGLEEAL